jgi:hypothetical protein
MSKLPNGLFGNISGKLNNVIVSSWKGIAYVKSRPTQINDPKTPQQATQRSRFSRIMSIMVPLSPVVRIGFKGYAEKMSAFNAAVSYNLKNAFSTNSANHEIQYANLLFSRGSYIGIVEGSCEPSGEGSILLAWSDKPAPGINYANDRIMVILINETGTTSHYYLDAGSRVQENIVLALPPHQQGDIIHCFVTMINPAKALSGNGKQGISESSYLGHIAAV